eukprot:scaffold61385_cov31-Attheya_sp.AAC.2
MAQTSIVDSNHNTETAQQTKSGKEDSVVGCHFGRREFRLRRALCEIYATTHSLDRSNPTGYVPVGYRGCLYQACRKQYIMLRAVIFSLGWHKMTTLIHSTAHIRYTPKKYGWPLLLDDGPDNGPDDCAVGSAVQQPALPCSMLRCDFNGPGSPTMTLTIEHNIMFHFLGSVTVCVALSV